MGRLLGWGVKFQTARKEYGCDLCGGTIAKGMEYGKYSPLKTYGPWTANKLHRFHLSCYRGDHEKRPSEIAVLKTTRPER